MLCLGPIPACRMFGSSLVLEMGEDVGDFSVVSKLIHPPVVLI